MTNQPKPKWLYSDPSPEAILRTYDQNPGLRFSKYHWCTECHYHALVYHLDQDRLICEQCGWVSPKWKHDG